MTRVHPVFFLVLGSLASCASHVVETNLGALPADSRIAVAKVSSDHSTWSDMSDKAKERIEKDEAEWLGTLERVFRDRIAGYGLDQGTGTEVPVEIVIVELNPGSQALRYWVGFGAGTGRAVATVKVGGHGEFKVQDKISGGWFGGSINSVMKVLGKAAADHIADQAGK
jgi:hypothetical protein